MTDTDFPTAPTLDEIGEIADRAFAALPEQFRSSCANVAILVEELPNDRICREMRLDSPYHLLGLYDGVNMIRSSRAGWRGPPDAILLFRASILRFATAEGYAIEDVVNHVLIHEIGHHMGFSDADMRAIEASANAQTIDRTRLQ